MVEGNMTCYAVLLLCVTAPHRTINDICQCAASSSAAVHTVQHNYVVALYTHHRHCVFAVLLAVLLYTLLFAIRLADTE
jgi:hypothetical protein